tara:strand:- start:1307 stop:2893 length:1587 start_codon:yes stop_codon:yes gene_type:complete
MSAYIGAGIAQGAQAVGQYAREKPERDLRMQEAQDRQKLSSLKLDEYQADSPMRQSAKDVEVQSLKNELYKGQSAGLQARTFSAFDKFQGDRNVRHLNNFLPDAKANPIGAKMFQNVTRYDSTDSPAGQKLLEQAGIKAGAEDTSQFVLATQADGKQVLMDMNQVFASTGYTKHMDDNALDRLSKEALNTQRLRSGMSSGRITDTQRLAEIIKGDNPDMTEKEAWEEATGILKPKSTGRGSELERLAEDLMADNPKLSKVEAYAEAVAMKKEGGTYKERLAGNREKGTSSAEDESLYTESTRSSDQVKIDEVNTAKDSLDEMFEGSFTDSDMTKPENRTKASRLMSRVEQEFPMNVADRKVAKEIRQLAALGDVAGSEITDQQAGPIDSLIRGVKKYISNDVEGVAGTAAYESFRNTLRHSLYGATVSKGETQTFTSAMGSLGEQKGPVLVKLKSQLGDLKEQLSSVYDMNDPYVAKYRLNMDQDQLADVISALDERIDMMDGMLKKDAPGVITPKLSIQERYNARNN